MLELGKGDAQLRHIDWAWASTVHAFQRPTVDMVIAAMEANHSNLTTQKTLHVEISQGRDHAELVTDDREEFQERLEAVALGCGPRHWKWLNQRNRARKRNAEGLKVSAHFLAPPFAAKLGQR